MIERASTCLEAGGRHLLRTAKPCLPNRRALHTAFWHHGASDLSLPVWWASVAGPDPPAGDEDGRGRAPLLDFLYPPKALALLRQISGPSTDAVETRRRHGLAKTDIRHFSTAPWRADQGIVDGAGLEEATQQELDQQAAARLREANLDLEVEETLAQMSAIDALHGLLLLREQGREALAWRLYAAVPASQRTPDLKTDLIDYLAAQPAPGVPHDAIRRLQEAHQEANLEVELEETLGQTSAHDALHNLLRLGEQGKQALAWELYIAVPELKRTATLKADLLEYLTAQPASVVPNDILHIFDALPPEHRRASSYRAAISAYLALEMIGPAVQLYELAAKKHFQADIGTDILLVSAVHDNQWALALRIIKAMALGDGQNGVDLQRAEQWRDASRKSGDYKAVWGSVAQLPYLRGHLQSLLRHIDQFQYELRSLANRRAVQHLLFGLAIETTEQLLNAKRPDEDAIWDFLIGLFEDLESRKFRCRDLYEHTIKRMLLIPRYREYTNNRKTVLEIYRRYRDGTEKAVKQAGGVIIRYRVPSQEVLRVLALQVGHFHSETGIENLVKDYRLFHPGEKLTQWMLTYIIDFYAELGRVDEVHGFFEEYHEAGYTLSLKVLTALPYVYARRIDVEGAEKQFKRLTEEFGKTPDTTAWNVLLLAYSRDDDLDGALACFNRLTAAVSPDIYTFDTLLNLLAARGDVEAYDYLYAKAEQYNINIWADMRARSGYVQALLNTGDPQGAEATAHTMLAQHKSGKLQGSLTETWNLLIQHHALNGDILTARRLYRQMVEHNIPLDPWTYGGLMRALVEARQTNAAYKILRVTMNVNHVRVHAFHYAIVITGFLRERQYKLALKANQRMGARNLPQTTSSRMASLHAIGLAEMKMLKEKGDQDPRTRLVALEEKLRDMLLSGIEADTAYRQPTHLRFTDSKQNAPEGYFGFLITLYGARGAMDICKELFEAVEIAREGVTNYEAPITLLVAIMETYLRTGDHDEVAKCWQLALAQADKLVKTVQKLANPSEAPAVDTMELTDPSLIEHYNAAAIAKNRRQILYKAMRLYVRSLLKQNTQEALAEVGRTIKSLIASGFVVDNLTWNEFVQALARRGRLPQAFSACEAYLMPHFPGWRFLAPYYHRKDQPGYSWMEFRHHDVTKQSRLPRYKTLVILARAFAQVRQDEANGLGYNPQMGAWTREILEQLGPETVRAIETMPKTGDPMQRKYLPPVI